MLPNCSCHMPAFITMCKTVSDSHGLKLNYPTSKISLCSSTSILSRCSSLKLASSFNIILIFNASLPSPSLYLKNALYCKMLWQRILGRRGKPHCSNLSSYPSANLESQGVETLPSSIFLPYVFECSLPKDDPSEMPHPWHEHTTTKPSCSDLTL